MIIFYNYIAFADWKCQQYSKALMAKLEKQADYDVVWYANRTRQDDHLRWDWMNKNWCKDDILMLEASKCPTEQMIDELAECKELLCSQLYIHSGGSSNFWDYGGDYPLWLCDKHVHQSNSNNLFCEATDVGIVKFSKKLQIQYRAEFKLKWNTADFMYDFHILNDWIAGKILVHKHDRQAAYRCQDRHVVHFDSGFSECVKPTAEQVEGDRRNMLKWNLPDVAYKHLFPAKPPVL